MNDSDILNKAIEKAVKGGYIYEWLKHDGAYKRYYELIFSHDFTKAFWGEEDYTDGKIVFCNLKAWQYHIQQMALVENRLKYLERFLDE